MAGGLFVAIVLEMGNSGFLSMQNLKVKRIVCFANSRKLGGVVLRAKNGWRTAFRVNGFVR